MQRQLDAFWRNERGATAIEYALVAGSISIAIVLTVGQLGQSVFDLFQLVVDAF